MFFCGEMVNWFAELVKIDKSPLNRNVSMSVAITQFYSYFAQEFLFLVSFYGETFATIQTRFL
jgi:hypothetical protein